MITKLSYEEFKKQVRITVEAREDETPVRGNVLVSGNDAEDKEAEDLTLERLDRGDIWAWALVCVKGTFKGLEYETYLGGCNYRDELDFKSCGYYADMVAEVVDQLYANYEEILEATPV